MAVTLSVMTGAFATGDLTNGKLQLAPHVGVLALISANLYVIFFNLSWGPVMWVMLGEMFPNQIRGSGLAVSGAAQWTANFLISVSFPVLAKSIGLPITYGFYAACAFVSIVFVREDGPRNPRHGIGGHGRLVALSRAAVGPHAWAGLIYRCCGSATIKILQMPKYLIEW